MNAFKIKYHAHPFEVGDKVVLVTSGPDKNSCFQPPLKYGRLYVIRETSIDEDGRPTVRLVGVFGPETWSGAEMRLYASHFISLAEMRANIADRLAARRGLRLDFMPDVEPKKQNGRKAKGRRKTATA